MTYNLDINDRAWAALKSKTKRIEIRTTTAKSIINFGNLKVQDTIVFSNSKNQQLNCIIKDINWYESIEELLTLEGTRYTLSSTNDYNEGIKSINSLVGYKESIKVNGIYAIHLDLL